MGGKGDRTVGKGSTVTVNAQGGLSSGFVFWDTWKTGDPFTYQAGLGRVITGWDQGCLGKLGEKRELTIPANEGYGARGFPAWKIPGNATLIFKIQVTNIA